MKAKKFFKQNKQIIMLVAMFVLVFFTVSIFGVEEVDISQKSRSWVVDMYVRGGFTMHLILLCSIFGVYIIIEKAVKLRKNIVMPENFVAQIRSITKSNDITQLMEFCKNKDISVAKVLDSGLKEYREGLSAVQGAIDKQGSAEINYFYKHLQMLGVLANMAPLFGFLGTVTGMITAFGVVAGYGSSRPDLLAAGVAEALITTAYGLFVGIPLLIFYYYFDSKVTDLSFEMQEFATNTVSELVHGGDLGGI